MKIEEYIDRLDVGCKHYNVKHLYLVGSFASGENIDGSDIDFLVSFNDLTKDGISDRYFGFLEFLQKELNSKVDLIEESAIKNPFFRDSINRNKKLIYG
ncbi:MAG: nucleotidyltransferase domain-containing protein [Bacteroidota bacterium]